MKMDKQFKHFLITQFNLRQFRSADTKLEDWINWTRNRIVLFKKYCLPSIVNQSNKDFTWLIYFDETTPEEFQYLFDELSTHKFIKPCFANSDKEFRTKHINDIKKNTRENEWLLISRVDNDDCLHKDAIDRIQKEFIAKDKFLISLASGYTFNTENKHLSHYFYPMSPFISIVEKNNGNILGVFGKEHSHWKELRLFMYKEILSLNKDSKFILDKPYWMQMIHGGNVANSARRGLPVLREKDLKEFALEMQSVKQSYSDIPKYYNYVYWKRYFKCSVVKLLRK